jgi:energy-coupling factor transport system ATP-binding protein
VIADGSPHEVLAREGERLAANGVWVPGFEPAYPDRSFSSGGAVALRTENLGIGREGALSLRTVDDLELRSARALAVTGPNGSGKSTLGLTLGGLLRSTAGRVLAAGPTGESDPFGWKSRELVSRIGSVFQDPEHQFITGSVRADLAIGPRAVGLATSETARRVDDLAVRLRLDALLDANPFTLSGGEKRRLSVATALITRPPILVLDEPTFGQDSRTWAELVALLAELLTDGTAIAAVSHDAAFVAAIADDVVTLGALGSQREPAP